MMLYLVMLSRPYMLIIMWHLPVIKYHLCRSRVSYTSIRLL